MNERKGTQANPYSYEEYLEMVANGKWNGGYVRVSETIVRWFPKQDQGGSGDEAGSGSDSGSGSGSGSNDKPKYMVFGGDVVINTPDQPFDSITISWGSGVALPHAACGGANNNGFYSDVSYELQGAPERFEVTTEDFCGYESAYEIRINISWYIPATRFHPEQRGTFETTYSIPEIYYDDDDND